jgi:hypothetical protein
MDHVSDAWDWSKEHAGGAIGAALSGAGEFTKGYAQEVGGGIAGAAGQAFHGAAWASDHAARAFSTLAVASYDNNWTPGHMQDLYNHPQDMPTPGQVFATDLKGIGNWGLDVFGAPGNHDATPGVDNLDTSAGAVANRKEFYENTWAGRLSSGTLDAAYDWFYDPLVIGGKAVKAGRVARTAFKNSDEVSTILKLHSGELQVAKQTGRQKRLVTAVDDFLKHDTNGEAWQIATHPILQDATNGGTYAYMLAQANKVADGAERLATKRDIYGTMLGNGASRARLGEKQQLLSTELDRLASPPPQPWSLSQFKWDDAEGAYIRQVNTGIAPEVEHQMTEIDAELARLDSILGSSGMGVASTSKVGTTFLERGKSAMAQSTIQAGIGLRPVRLVTALASNRLPGHISTKDVDTGFSDLRSYLAQAVDVDPATRSDLLNSYLKATSPMERGNVLKAAEAHANRATAAKYGMDPVGADSVLQLGRRRAEQVMSNIQARLQDSRLYSADSNARIVHLHDPEADEIIAGPKALFQSQAEDMVAMVPPDQLRKLYKVASDARYTQKIVGKNVADLVGGGKDKVNSFLLGLTRVWKDNVLFRLAYPARIQVDTQGRQMVYMGALGYLGTRKDILKSAVANAPKAGTLWNPVNVAKVAKGTAGAIVRGLDEPTGIHMIMKATGLDADEAAKAFRLVATKDGGIADLLADSADRRMGQLRASGQWSDVTPQNPGWGQAYIDGVNKQLRNSPTAMKIAEGLRGAELKTWIRTTAAGRQEWRALKDAYGGDLDLWLDKATHAVDHLLPESHMAETALGRGITASDLEKWYPKGAMRPVVHGQSYMGLDPKGPWESLSAGYNRLRNGYYKMASEAPENILGRVPMFNYAYKKELKNILDRMEADGLESLAPETITNVQRSAMDKARREVGAHLYEASHTSNLATTFPNIAPFFGPVEDVLKKWGTLFYDKPYALPRFEDVMNSPAQAGLLQDEYGNSVDSQGNVYDVLTGKKLDPSNAREKSRIGRQRIVTIPASWIPKAVRDATGIDKFEINTKSLNLIFQGDTPFLPGAGPMVGAPVNALVAHAFPEIENNTLVKHILPYGPNDGDMKDQFLAGWQRHLVNVFGGKEFDQAYLAIAKAEDAKYKNGERKTAPTGEEISNKARMWQIMRTATAFGSPVSMTPTPEAQLYQDMFNAYQQRAGQAKQDAKPGMKTLSAEEAWYRDFPHYFAMTAHLSANETGINATLKAVDETKKHASLIAANPDLGWAIVGPDNQYGDSTDTRYSQGASAWLKTNTVAPGSSKTYRGSVDPQVALDKAQSGEGWIIYQQGMTRLNLALEERGLHSYQQKGAEDLAAAKEQFIGNMKTSYPKWGEDFDQIDMGKVSRFLRVGQSWLQTNRDLANRADMKDLSLYLQGREQIRAALAQRGLGGLDNKYNADLKLNWDQFASALVRDNIGFEQMWNRILQKDDLSDGTG